MKSEFGIIGLGVMGKNLALNLASKGVKLAAYNRHIEGKEEGIAQKLADENPEHAIVGFDDLNDFVSNLDRPRKILLMITAGNAVDQQILELLPMLEEGDVVLDGGNSFYKDSSRRSSFLKKEGIHFVGTGISGGEEGALKGPAIMPGGPIKGYQEVERFLNLIAAKDKQGNACSTYIGPEGAGHFVKMVHNGIEYAEMQLLAETYAILRDMLAMESQEIAEIFNLWQNGSQSSYLLGITVDILKYQEGEGLLLDKILDQAEQKGTGWLSAATALEYGVPYDNLAQAVFARNISSYKNERVKASKLFSHTKTTFSGQKEWLLKDLEHAYRLGRLINHDNGFNLIKVVSEKNEWNLNLSELSRIWTNGCIIRSTLMEELVSVFKSSDRILFAELYRDTIANDKNDLAEVVSIALKGGLALPVYSSTMNYLLGAMTENSTANLIQAQRDYFGAHSYKRNDMPSGSEQYFHTNWKK